MKCAIQFEDKVSRSRSKHEGESSASLCGKPIGRTRVISQRQLPTDHDYAVPTREYQLDQSSPLPATAAADPVLDQKNDQRTLTGHYISGKYRRQTARDHSQLRIKAHSRLAGGRRMLPNFEFARKPNEGSAAVEDRTCAHNHLSCYPNVERTKRVISARVAVGA